MNRVLATRAPGRMDVGAQRLANRSRPESFGVVRSRRSRRSRTESFGVDRSRSKSESIEVGVVRSRPESSEVVRNRQESELVGVNRSLCACDQTFPFVVFFVFHFVRALLLQAFVSTADLGRLQTTPDDSVCSRFRINPDDSGYYEWLRKTPNDSKRLRTTPNDSERLRMMQGGPNFRSRFRTYRSWIGVDFGFIPALHITTKNTTSMFLFL